jgi:Ca2+-binding RTX toxin-like protein
MNNIKDAYVNALLADASYVRLHTGGDEEGPMTPLRTDEDLINAIAARMTRTQAIFITDNFELLNQELSLTGGFDATVWRGKNGTQYEGKAYVSIRGTQQLSDFADDHTLFNTGLAPKQLVSMVNWWLRETTPRGQSATQIKVNDQLLAPEPFLKDIAVEGTESLAAISIISQVDGHSLGGYLATAFTRLFGARWNIEHTTTFNSAGFRAARASEIDKVFAGIQNLIGTNLGHSTFNSETAQDNFFAENGVNLTTNDWNNSVGFKQYGKRIGLFQEDGLQSVFGVADLDPFSNHYMFKLTDLLAIGATANAIDETLSFSTLNDLLKASSNVMAGSYEGTLDSFRRMLLGNDSSATSPSDAGDNADLRVKYQDNIKELRENATFKALRGQASVTLATDPTLAERATIDFGSFLALNSLSPAVFLSNMTGQALLKQANERLAALWEADSSLTAAQRVAGINTFTKTYYLDRQAMLQGLIAENIADQSYEKPLPGKVNANYTYTDLTSGKTIKFSGSAPNANSQESQQVMFGNDQGNGLVGSDSAAYGLGDRLYGGAGNDYINGKAGDDYLEGNEGDDTLNGGDDADTLLGGAGNDTLDGGKGADQLKGGQGNDTYILRADTSDVTDTILDSDASGSVKVVGPNESETVLTGGKRLAGSEGIWQSDDQRFTYTTRTESDGSTTLRISGAGVKAQVKNFTSGDLGIILPGNLPSPVTPTTNLTILGDLEPASPPQVDPLGNIVTTSTAAPDRSDTLYDGTGNDLLESFGGNDSIDLSRGGSNWAKAGTGRDFVNGGPGADLIEGGAGRDVAFGQVGDDEIWGNTLGTLDDLQAQTDAAADSEADLLGGGPGNDKVMGWAGNDALFGGSDRDTIVGGAGADTIFGDRVFGSVSLTDWAVQRQVTTDAQGVVTSRKLTFSNFVVDMGLAPDADVILAGAGDDWVLADGGDDFVKGGTGNDYLVGGTGGDALFGEDGDDELVGDGDTSSATLLNYADPAAHGNDYLDGGDGADRLTGGGGNDELAGGAGNDVLIGDSNALAGQYHGEDLLDGGSGDDEMAGGGRDDILFGGDGDDTMDGDSSQLAASFHGQDYLEGDAGNDTMVGNGDDDTLYGGTGNDLLWGDSQTLDAQYHGDDFLYGEEGDDELVGGGGNDTLSGGEGNDKLYGDDQFIEASHHGDNDLDGGAGDDYLRGYGGNDLLKGGSGKDTLIGEAGNDTLEGGTESDLLSGGAGDDTYVFNTGDSLAAAAEFVDDSEGTNSLILNGLPISSTDLLPTADRSIHLLQSGQDAIYVRGLTTGAMGNVTVDGVSYTAAQFFGMTYARQVDQTSTLAGSTLQGGKLADTLRGSGGGSNLAGGLGNDTLIGSGGGNTYVYGVGDGIDTASNTPLPAGASTSLPPDKLLFGPGVNPQDIQLSVAGTMLVLKIGGETPGEFRLTGFDPADALRPAGLDQFEFADGTVLSHAQLVARGFDIAGTSASETLTGTSRADRLSGGAGSDILTGGAGDDTYTFEVGSGIDVIADGDAAAGTNDTLELGWSVAPWEVTFFRSASDAIVVVGTEQVTLKDYFAGGADAVEHIRFADGTILSQAEVTSLLQQGTDQDDVIVGDGASNTLYGRGGNDTISALDGDDVLAGGTGSDMLDGGPGNDSFLFNLGDGADVITDGSGADVLRFGAGITAADVTILDSGSDLKLQVGAAGDLVTLKNYLAPSPNAALIETIEFADGSTWQLSDVLSRRLVGTAGDDVLTGFERDDAIDAGAGNDTVYARGGADVIDGGAGDDRLYGQAGNDTYVIYPLGGNDILAEDLGGLLADADRVRFGGGLVKADMVFTRNGSDLLVTSTAKGVAVRIVNQFAATQDSNGVESMEFSDGAVLDRTAIRQLVSVPTAGDDVLTGDDSNESIDALGGNDVVYGLGGDDVLRGNTGADTLYGGAGNDTYDFRIGDGVDLVNDLGPFGGSGGTDTLRLGAGITPASVILQRQDNDLQVATASASDKVIIAGYYSRGDFERIAFADGTVWTQTTIATKLPINGTAGADTITGTAAADLIDGGTGPDTIHGGAGDDVIRGGVDKTRKITYRDELYGDEGDDYLVAGDAEAILWGGAGNDILEGGISMLGEGGNNLLIGGAKDEAFTFLRTGNNIIVAGAGTDRFTDEPYNPASGTPPPTGRSLFLYNAGDGDDQGYFSPFNDYKWTQDIVSIGKTTYNRLGLAGGLGTDEVQLAVGRVAISRTDYFPGNPLLNKTKYVQIFVSGHDYSPTSTDPLRNRKVVVVDYESMAADYFATAVNNRTFDLEAALRRHIVWTSDTQAFGGKIAFQYATQGNIDAVTLEERRAILADPNLNLLAQPITGGAAVVTAIAQPSATMFQDLLGAAVSDPSPASAPPDQPLDLWTQVDAWSRRQAALAPSASNALDPGWSASAGMLHSAILFGAAAAGSADLPAGAVRVDVPVGNDFFTLTAGPWPLAHWMAPR